MTTEAPDRFASCRCDACREVRRLRSVLDRVETLVAPQWRRTYGEEYSQGRNDMIDAVRAALAAGGGHDGPDDDQ